MQYRMFINGEWVESESKETFESINPATGEVISVFPKGNEKDVKKAVEAAKNAFKKWKNTPAPVRGGILLEAARIMKDRKDELGKLVSMELGKVVAEGNGDVQEGLDFTEYIAGEGRRLLGETYPCELKNKKAMMFRMPKGVVGLITPWNFPFAIPCWKIMPALVAGNTIVFKPATDTPTVAAKLVDILHEAGVPKGVLNMVTGSGSVVGSAIVNHKDVSHISLTGSVEVGREVYKSVAERIGGLHLELGGKNPQIIMKDADLDIAIEGVLFGAFGSQGQRCTATSRLIVEKDVYDEVLRKLIDRLKDFKIGNPLDPKMSMGPVINESQMNKILEYIEIGKREDKLVYGGNRLVEGDYSKGFFIEPTIFESEHGTTITKEEIFGPVLSVIKVNDFEEAVRIANDVDYGLSSSIYTKDINRAMQAVDNLEAGLVYINAPTIGAEIQLPFGGVKNTGNGHREAGTTAIDEFTEIKTVVIDYSGKLQKAQIKEEDI